MRPLCLCMVKTPCDVKIIKPKNIEVETHETVPVACNTNRVVTYWINIAGGGSIQELITHAYQGRT